MPFCKRTILPKDVCKGDPRRKSPVITDLVDVCGFTLCSLLRQLSNLSRQSVSILEELESELVSICHRSATLESKVVNLQRHISALVSKPPPRMRALPGGEDRDWFTRGPSPTHVLSTLCPVIWAPHQARRHVIDPKAGDGSDPVQIGPGNLCMVTAGAYSGRIGTVADGEWSPGSLDVVPLKDSAGNSFSTSPGNILVLGKSNKPWVASPYEKSARMILTKEMEERLSAEQDSS